MRSCWRNPPYPSFVKGGDLNAPFGKGGRAERGGICVKDRSNVMWSDLDGLPLPAWRTPPQDKQKIIAAYLPSASLPISEQIVTVAWRVGARTRHWPEGRQENRWCARNE
jgi:hypothetical protein